MPVAPEDDMGYIGNNKKMDRIFPIIVYHLFWGEQYEKLCIDVYKKYLQDGGFYWIPDQVPDF